MLGLGGRYQTPLPDSYADTISRETLNIRGGNNKFVFYSLFDVKWLNSWIWALEESSIWRNT